MCQSSEKHKGKNDKKQMYTMTYNFNQSNPEYKLDELRENTVEA